MLVNEMASVLRRPCPLPAGEHVDPGVDLDLMAASLTDGHAERIEVRLASELLAPGLEARAIEGIAPTAHLKVDAIQTE